MAVNTKRISRLIRWNRWEKIKKILEKGDSETRMAIAAELGTTTDDHAYNLLILLLKDDDEKVQLQVIKSLGELGAERAKVHLQNMLSDTKEGTELYKAILDSISKINEKLASEE
jgi:HEAT repeat protein